MELSINARARRAAARRRERPATRAFATVVLDVDRGISQIDGIEWLAERRSGLLVHGTYADRLAAIRPRRDEVDALSRAYVDALAPNCVETIARFTAAGVRTVIVSQGLHHAMYRLINRLGIDAPDVHAVDIWFDPLGAFAGFDRRSPLASADGKRAVVAALDVERPMLVVGEADNHRPIGSFTQLASIVLP